MAADTPTIASAAVALRIKMPGVQKDIYKSIGGADMPGLGKSMGSRLGEGMKKALKVGAVAAGTAAAAGIGTAMFKGFQRLSAIDQANAKLRGLGHSASSVDTIMSNALASVKGTAFGLDAAATTAAGAVAAGISPGKQLEGVLKSVANSAAAAGVPMEEFGSIYNKVASIGKAQNDSLQQVADRGIPIYQALADQLGVTADEVFTMASKGEIGFSQFEAAMTSAAGNVAAEMGNTVTGSFANFMASVGRIGAGFLGGVFPKIAPALQSVTAAFGPLEEIAGRVGERIGSVLGPAIERVVGTLQSGVDLSMFSPFALVFQTLAPVLPIVSDALQQVSSVVGGALSSVLSSLLPLVAQLLVSFSELVASILPPLMPVLTLVATIFADILTAAMPLINALVSLLTPVLQVLAPVIQAVVAIATPLVKVLGALLTPVVGWLAEKLTGLVDVITGIVSGILPAFSQGWEQIKSMFEGVVGAFSSGSQQVGGFFTSLGAAVSTAYLSYIKPVFDGIAAAAQWLFTTVLQPVFNAFMVIWNIVWGLLVGTYEAIIKPILDAIGGLFSWLWQSVIQVAFLAIQGAIIGFGVVMRWMNETIVQPVISAVGSAWNWLNTSVIQPVILAIRNAINVWASIFRWLYNVVLKPIFNAIAALFRWTLSVVIMPVVNLIKTTIRGLGAIFTWLYVNAIKPSLDGAGRAMNWLFLNVVQPVWNGIKATINTAWLGIKTIIDTLVKVVRSDPKRAFEAARDAIGRAWDRIKDLAKAPVKFVVQTVINDGLIGTINKFLPKKWKLNTLKLPAGFRTGGYTGNAGLNEVAGVVHGREHVTRAESTAKLNRSHPGLLDHMNRYGTVPGFRKGGYVTPLPRGSYSVSQPFHSGHNGIDLAAPTGTKTMSAAPGVVTHAGWEPGGSFGGGNQVNVLHAGNILTWYAHLSSIAARVGKQVKAGEVIGRVGSTGNSTGPHLHYMIETGYKGSLGSGNWINPAPYMTGHTKPQGGGGAIEAADGLMGWVEKKLKDAGTGMWGDIGAGMAMSVAENVISFIKSKIPVDIGSAGTPTLYDNGGLLQPGISLVENRSGRPEPILTGGQWDDLLGSRGGAQAVYVQNPFTGEYLLAKVDDRADERIDVANENAARTGRLTRMGSV